MSDETVPRAIRLSTAEWQAFRALQQQLQQLTPHATVTIRDTFKTAVSSTSAVVARGDLPWATGLPREAPPRRDPT